MCAKKAEKQNKTKNKQTKGTVRNDHVTGAKCDIVLKAADPGTKAL